MKKHKFSILMTRQLMIIILIISYSADVFVLIFSPSSPKIQFQHFKVKENNPNLEMLFFFYFIVYNC